MARELLGLLVEAARCISYCSFRSNSVKIIAACAVPRPMILGERHMEDTTKESISRLARGRRLVRLYDEKMVNPPTRVRKTPTRVRKTPTRFRNLHLKSEISATPKRGLLVFPHLHHGL